MRWLKAVIARVLRGRGSQGTARPTQPAGLVRPEHMTQVGSKPSVPTTFRPHQPAPPAQKRSPDRVDLTKLGVRHGSVRALALAERQLTQGGSRKAAPASQLHPLVSPQSKPVKTPANPTKTAAKRTPSKTPAQTRMGNQSKVNGN
jgi:hypothetical protein